MRHIALATSFLGLAAASLLAGCPDRTISPVDPQQGRVEAKDIPVKINRNVDILFVIDDSPSMGDKQRNLAQNFPKFIEELKKIPGGLPSVHIGVTTSDLGTRGADGVIAPTIGTLNQGGCAGTGKGGILQLYGAPVSGGPFISDIVDDMTGIRTQNYPMGTKLEDVFAQIAKGAGVGGCGFEQHLEAMKVALTKTTTPNANFLRDDAYLAVILIADEDDCSMEHTTLLGDNAALGPRQSFRCTRFGITCDQNGATTDAMNAIGAKGRCHPNDGSAYLTKVAEYAKFLKGLKPNDPSKVIVAGITGPQEPVATELRAPDKNSSPIPALAHSCNYTSPIDNKLEVADPAVRLRFFLDQFPGRSTFVPICQADLRDGMQQIGDLLKSVIGDPCIEGALKGPPYECSVSTVTNPNAPTPTKALLDHCTPDSAAATNKPCWRLAVDNTNCSTTPTKLAITIEGRDLLPSDTHVLANCVTEVTNN